MFTAQPTEYQSCNQCTSTGGKTDRDTSQMHSQRTDKATDQNTESDKNHICLIRRPINISHLFSGSFHLMFHSGKFQNITGVHHCPGKYRDIDTRTFDTTDTNPVHKLLRPDFGNRFSGKSPVCHHNRQSFRRKVQ